MAPGMLLAPLVAEIIGPDLLIILIIVAVLFGGSRLPKLARSLGSAKAEFEKGVAEGVAGTAAAAPAPAPKAPEEEKVTLTRAELDAAIAEREARGRAAAARPEPPEAPEPPA